MDELRSIYRQEIREHLETLSDALAALDRGEVAAREVIRSVAHQLKGSGASFGFPEITDRAAAVMDAGDEDLAVRARRLVETVRDVAEAGPSQPGGPILIVDDDRPMQTLLRRTLEDGGYEVTVARTSKEGRARLRQGVALVLLDLRLPDGDGRELLRDVAAAPGTPPVVVLTATDHPDVVQECRELGAAAFIAKPFAPAEVAATVGGLLAARGAIDEVRPLHGDDVTILLAEDDDLVASLIVDRLSRDGFSLVHCRDGGSALAAATAHPPDLAILDVKMPKMDGFELLDRFHEIPALHDMPVIVLTAMGSERDVLRGFELGAADYIVKPFSPTELAARVHRLVDER